MPTPRPKEVLEAESTVTSRGQTTIPGSIRKALMLGPADKVRYVLMDDKTVVLTRSDENDEHDDPVVAEFLAFLAADMQANPANVQPIAQDLLARARDLTDGVTVDLDVPLDPEDE